MERFVMITAAGPDRPGIVSGITQALHQTGCNIEDSSMTLLRGEFAMMIIVRLPLKGGMAAVKARLKKVQQRLGLSLLMRPLSAQEASRSAGRAGRVYMLSVYGADQPGIVYRVSRLLSSKSVNITDMNTRVVGSSAKPIYVMLLELELPPGVKVPSLRAELRKLKKALSVDIDLHPVETVRF